VHIIDRKWLDVSSDSCHAATIAFHQNKPVFAWFGGIREGDPSCSIYIQYDSKVVIFGQEGIPKWNPILFSHEGRLFLFLKSGLFCDRWQTFILDITNIFEKGFDIRKISIDLLPAGLNGPVKTKPIVKSGLIYCGSSVETIYDWTSYIETYLYDKDSRSLVFVRRSDPLTVPKVTHTDYYGRKVPTLGIIQPSLWVDKYGNMNAFFRSSRGLGYIYFSRSMDERHEIWDNPSPTVFDNPNSGIDTVYCNGKLFLVHNPNKEYRYPLVISELEGSTLMELDNITVTEEISEKERTNTLELSYPYMIEHQGKLHLVYTYGRSKIEHVTVEI